jgi:hypothetical protein
MLNCVTITAIKRENIDSFTDQLEVGFVTFLNTRNSYLHVSRSGNVSDDDVFQHNLLVSLKFLWCKHYNNKPWKELILHNFMCCTVPKTPIINCVFLRLLERNREEP